MRMSLAYIKFESHQLFFVLFCFSVNKMSTTPKADDSTDEKPETSIGDATGGENQDGGTPLNVNKNSEENVEGATTDETTRGVFNFISFKPLGDAY